METPMIVAPRTDSVVNTLATLLGTAVGFSGARLAHNKAPGIFENPLAETGEVLLGGAGHVIVEGEGPLTSGIDGVSLGVAFHGANKLIQRGIRKVIAMRDDNAANTGDTTQNGALDLLAAAGSDNYYPVMPVSRTTVSLPEANSQVQNGPVREISGVQMLKADGLAASIN